MYLINLNDIDDSIDVPLLPDKRFMAEAKKQGNVYELDDFCAAFNEDELSSDCSYIRALYIVETPVS